MPRCGFPRLEAFGSAHRSNSECMPPSLPESATLADDVGTVIDAPIISAIPPFPPNVAVEDAPQGGSGGRVSSDRTLFGSATRRVRTPTPSPTPLIAGTVGKDDREVTQRVRGSSSWISSPHPLLYPISTNAHTIATGGKRQRVAQEDLPEDFKKVGRCDYVCAW